jgi:hypothetical protein
MFRTRLSLAFRGIVHASSLLTSHLCTFGSSALKAEGGAAKLFSLLDPVLRFLYTLHKVQNVYRV